MIRILVALSLIALMASTALAATPRMRTILKDTPAAGTKTYKPRSAGPNHVILAPLGSVVRRTTTPAVVNGPVGKIISSTKVKRSSEYTLKKGPTYQVQLPNKPGVVNVMRPLPYFLRIEGKAAAKK
jgi:hypothetical protein